MIPMRGLVSKEISVCYGPSPPHLLSFIFLLSFLHHRFIVKSDNFSQSKHILTAPQKFLRVSTLLCIEMNLIKTKMSVKFKWDFRNDLALLLSTVLVCHVCVWMHQLRFCSQNFWRQFFILNSFRLHSLPYRPKGLEIWSPEAVIVVRAT